MNKKIRNSGNDQYGIALIAALITLLLISAITAGMIVLSTTETNISSNFRDQQTAFFAARAGIEEARDRLRTTATNTLRTAGVLPTTMPGTSSSVLYILNPANGETVAPWGTNYPDDEICKETTSISCSNGLPTGSGWYNSVSASSVYTASPVLPWKWTRITLKQNNTISPFYTNGSSANTSQVCWNGTNEFASSTGCTAPNLPVYILTALAVTPNGSRRMLQTEVAEDQVNFTAPSPLTMDGTGDVFSGPNGNNFGVDGTDHQGCGSTTTGGSLPAIAVTDNADIATVTAGIPSNRKSHYTGSGGSTPDVENVTLPPNLQSVSSLNTLLSTIKNNVTQPVINGPASGISNPGTATAPQIIYVNGDLTLSGNTTGYGILVVTGTFTASGDIGWNGLVLVVGKGVFNGNGGGNGSYNGAVVVANTVDSLGNPLNVLGPPQFNFNGGGNNGINYSSGCIAQATQLSTFHVMVIRELMN